MIRSLHIKSRKLRAMIAVIPLMCFLIMIILSPLGFSDWREWVGIVLCAVGGGMAIAGGLTTSPVWRRILTAGGGAVILVGAIGMGIAISDDLDDSDEDAVCSRCGVTYNRDLGHIWIVDYTDAEPLPEPPSDTE